MNQSGKVWVVLADIHANYCALKHVLEDARKRAEDMGIAPDQLQYISLGDVVDYGPEPSRCLKWVEAHCMVKIRGNHDLEASRCPRVRPMHGVQRDLWPVLIWTRCRLTSQQRQLLRGWPRRVIDIPGLPRFVLAHADLDGNYFQTATYPDEMLFKRLLETGAKYGLLGHSHQQVLVQRRGDGTCIHLPVEQGQKEWKYLPQDGHVVLNPGGLGQQRRPNLSTPIEAKAQYLLLDTRNSEFRFWFCQVEYNKEKTAARLKEIALPNPLPDSCSSPEDRRMPTLSPEEVYCLYAGLQIELEYLIQQILHVPV